MNYKDLAEALRRLKVETGSLACFGCGYEHRCSTHGCAILRGAEELASIMGRNFNEETLKKMLGSPEWVPVSERLPKAREDVLVRAYWHETWQTMVGWHEPQRGFFAVSTPQVGIRTDLTVTHWMPLPEPPKEVAADAGD